MVEIPDELVDLDGPSLAQPDSQAGRVVEHLVAATRTTASTSFDNAFVIDSGKNAEATGAIAALGLGNLVLDVATEATDAEKLATLAETNRAPFDLPEAEAELVTGYNVEYSAMTFALFFLGEYCAMTVMACLTTVLFLGGYQVPFWEDAPWFVQLGAFGAKVGFFLFLFIWVRWTLPRFRYDQLMNLGWKVFLPVALANLLVVGALIALGWA